MLRPVVQDYLLPTACYVGGAAEIAYFAQISEAYRILDRPITPIFNRQSLTVVESKHKRTLEKFALDFKDMFLGLDAILERVGQDQLSSETVNLFDEAEAAITEKLDGLELELADIDSTLLPNLEKRRQKMMHNLRALKKRPPWPRSERTKQPNVR